MILVLAGLLQLGTYIKLIPYPVTVGFTAGIGVIIFASQVEELLGLRLIGAEPGPLLDKVPVLWNTLPTVDPATVAVSLVRTTRRMTRMGGEHHMTKPRPAIPMSSSTASPAPFSSVPPSIGLVLDRIANTHRVLVIDLSAVPFLDSTAAKTVEGLAHNAARRGSRIILTGVSSDVQRALFAHGVKPPLVKYKADIHAALRENRTRPPT